MGRSLVVVKDFSDKLPGLIRWIKSMPWGEQLIQELQKPLDKRE